MQYDFLEETMKKTFSMVLAALLLAGTATITLAADNAPAALSQDEINLTDEATYISSGNPFSVGKLEDAFDGDITTVADLGGVFDDYWIGIKLPAPSILTYIEVYAPDYDGDGMPNRTHAPHGTIVEGSNDGENWEFILQLGDNYNEFLEYDWDMKDGFSYCYDEIAFDGEDSYDDDAMDPVEYTYYRVWNNDEGIAVYGDVQFYGYFTEPVFTKGDLNCDDALDINDAILLFRNAMMPDMYPIDGYQGDSLDFNGDDFVDINDAIRLFQHSMLPDMFPLA